VVGSIPANANEEPGHAPIAAADASEAKEAPSGTEAAQAPSTAALAHVSLRDAAQRVLVAWDDEANERGDLSNAMAALWTILVKPAPASRIAASGSRKPREGTKRQQVPIMLRRPEGATVAQTAEATSWQAHTVRGFFASLKKRGAEVGVLERVRQVGLGRRASRALHSYQITE
jgi:hypothetical protein